MRGGARFRFVPRVRMAFQTQLSFLTRVNPLKRTNLLHPLPWQARWAGLSFRPSTMALTILLAGFMLSSCGRRPQVSTAASPTGVPAEATATITPTPSPAPPTPTPTPVPLAARVNGEPITLEQFEINLQRFETAQVETDTDLAPDKMRELVLEDMLDQLLLAQAAQDAGFIVDQVMVDERIEALAAQVGGEAGLEAWQQAHDYNPETFRQDLARAISAAWMRDQIVDEVPARAEQVYVRQILLYNSGDASAVLEQLKAGEDFETLARAYDPQGFGELGWFPRGYLTVPEVETAAFALQPGEISEVIESPLGFHVLKVVDRSDDRLLDPQARTALQLQALRMWLDKQRVGSDIEIFLATGT